MRASTREWLEKAEADFISAGREYRARKHPNYDAACFFAQQCVEKYLKARLVEAQITFPRTHDLEALLDLVLPVQPLWGAFRPLFADLTAFAVAFRYPGESATRQMAGTGVQNAKRVRAQMRRDMGLPET